MTGSKIIAGSPSKVWQLYFVVAVSVLPPICCRIGSGMPYLWIFVEEVAPFLGAMADKWV